MSSRLVSAFSQPFIWGSGRANLFPHEYWRTIRTTRPPAQQSTCLLFGMEGQHHEGKTRPHGPVWCDAWTAFGHQLIDQDHFCVPRIQGIERGVSAPHAGCPASSRRNRMAKCFFISPSLRRLDSFTVIFWRCRNYFSSRAMLGFEQSGAKTNGNKTCIFHS